MNDLSVFIGQNWLLILAFIGLILAIIYLETNRHTNSLPPEQVIFRINREQAVVIDIREKAAFDKVHLAKAKRLKPVFPEQKNPWKKFNKKQIILICEDGRESARHLSSVKKSVNHDDVFFLDGGIAAWRQQHFPLIQGGKK